VVPTRHQPRGTGQAEPLRRRDCDAIGAVDPCRLESPAPHATRARHRTGLQVPAAELANVGEARGFYRNEAGSTRSVAEVAPVVASPTPNRCGVGDSAGVVKSYADGIDSLDKGRATEAFARARESASHLASMLRPQHHTDPSDNEVHACSQPTETETGDAPALSAPRTNVGEPRLIIAASSTSEGEADGEGDGDGVAEARGPMGDVREGPAEGGGLRRLRAGAMTSWRWERRRRGPL